MNENKGAPDVPYFVYEARMAELEWERRAWMIADIVMFLVLIGSNAFWVYHVFF